MGHLHGRCESSPMTSCVAHCCGKLVTNVFVSYEKAHNVLKFHKWPEIVARNALPHACITTARFVVFTPSERNLSIVADCALQPDPLTAEFVVLII